MEICPECKKEVRKDRIHDYAYYYPFTDEPISEGKHCERCYDNSGVSYCESCGRDVYNNTGYRKNVRYIEKEKRIMCVGCLQKLWFQEGMNKFSEGDWFNDNDLQEHGFSKHGSYFCRDQVDYDRCKEQFAWLQEKFGKAIVSIERSGMGFEHHIALWYKKGETND